MFVVYYLTNTLMIEINNLLFGYNKRKLLYKGLNLKLEDGCIYGLLGKNGAGKSTLLKLITGMLFPLEGEIKVSGFIPKKRQPSFLESLYFIPEEVDVPPVSLSKYIRLFSPFYPNFNKENLLAYLDDLEVSQTGKLSDLSFGQQKKFIIAFALACNTSLLILDEPTNGLDIPSKSWFRKLISMAVNEKRIIIISTHQVRDLDNLIDSVILVNEGDVLIQKPLQEISEKLVFKTQLEIEEELDVLYSEKALKGFSYVATNSQNEDTKVNLEQLFEACTKSPERIKSIFNK
jgi:ABC-2 type transport system ATP-binding protein